MSILDISDEAIIRQNARDAGFGEDILILDLVGGCGVTSQVTGHLWRVFEPASGQALVICLAEEIYLGDVEALGLDKETPFICYEGALDERAKDFLVGETELMFVE